MNRTIVELELGRSRSQISSLRCDRNEGMLFWHNCIVCVVCFTVSPEVFSTASGSVFYRCFFMGIRSM